MPAPDRIGRRRTFAAFCGVWLAICLGLAAGAVPRQLCAAESRHPRNSADLRQLSAPYPATRNARSRRVIAARYGVAPRRHRHAGPARRRPAEVRIPTIPRRARGSGPDRRSLARTQQLVPHWWADDEQRRAKHGGLGPRRLYCRDRAARGPSLGAQLRVEQLLILPRADGAGDGRLDEFRALGVPVIRDVPPIAIVNPRTPDRFPVEALIRRRAR